jgi:hypothetical protein
MEHLRDIQAQKLRARLRCSESTAQELARMIFGEVRQ